jgi:ribosomal protein L22
MASTNTEKPTGKAEQKKQAPVKTSKKKDQPKAPIEDLKKEEIKENPEEKKEENKNQEKKVSTKEKKEDKKEKKKVETKKVKKDEVKVVGKYLPASTKVAASICKFIKNKPIEVAIKDLQEVQKKRKAVPMKGEIPHRKGKIMSGRFPVKVSSEVERLLKSLQGNANQHDVEEPIITKAIANMASRPLGKKGRISKKRSHITIWATEKSKMKMIKQNKNKNPKKVEEEKK